VENYNFIDFDDEDEDESISALRKILLAVDANTNMLNRIFLVMSLLQTDYHNTNYESIKREQDRLLVEKRAHSIASVEQLPNLIKRSEALNIVNIMGLPKCKANVYKDCRQKGNVDTRNVDKTKFLDMIGWDKFKNLQGG
jgi:hypothetical protein